MRLALAALLTALATPSAADEIRMGALAHNTAILGDTVTSGREPGQDVKLEWAGDGGIRPFASLSANDYGGTNFAALGLETQLGTQWFISPGAGVAVHDGKLQGARDDLKLGSRALIYSRLDAGYQSGCWRYAFRVEHLSNGHMARPNNGLDNFGFVIGKKLGC